MSKRFFYVSLGVLALGLAVASADARTWHIQPDGTGDAPTIQAAVDQAIDGDVVELANGTFEGSGNRGVFVGGMSLTIVETAF